MPYGRRIPARFGARRVHPAGPLFVGPAWWTNTAHATTGRSSLSAFQGGVKGSRRGGGFSKTKRPERTSLPSRSLRRAGRRSVRIGGEDLAAVGGHEGAERDDADGVLEEPDAAVAQEDVCPAG